MGPNLRRRKLIAAKPKKGSPIVDEALLRIAALSKVEDSRAGVSPSTAGFGYPPKWAGNRSTPIIGEANCVAGCLGVP